MIKPVVIAFCGRAGSGKTTASAHIQKTYEARRAAFTQPLKKLAQLLYGFSDEQVYGTQAQKEAIDHRVGISPRTGMIRLGDGARQIIGPRVWIEPCFVGIVEDARNREYERARDTLMTKSPLYTIEDVRHLNEVQAIRSEMRFSGHVIKLVCPDSDSASEYANASSEVSVDEIPEEFFTEVIVSNKSPGSVDLKTKVDAAVVRILGAQ